MRHQSLNKTKLMNFVKYGITFCILVITISLGIVGIARANIVYLEDFSTDPNISTSPDYRPQDGDSATWNTTEENFEVYLKEYGPGAHKYALTPPFQPIVDSSFDINFDLRYAKASWGMGMKIYFLQGEMPAWSTPGQDSPDGDPSFIITMTDNYRMTMYARSGIPDNESALTPSVDPSKWYNISIQYNDVTQTANFVLVDLSNETVFYEEYDIPFVPPTFDRIAFGAKCIFTDGTDAEMRVDNIRVSQMLINLDSDGDGYNDEREFIQGTNPYGPVSFLGIPDIERDVLIDFYNAMSGDSWNDNTGWKDPPLASDGFGVPGAKPNWKGLECQSHRTGIVSIGGGVGGGSWGGTASDPFDGFRDTVEGLWFYLNNLNGTITPSLRNLTNLDTLALSGNNQLYGVIPPELGELENLKILRIGGQQITDPIPPELGNLINLQELSLGSNQYSYIPPELGNLINLTSLTLVGNHFTSIPPELGNLINLGYLRLDHNQITSAIPPVSVTCAVMVIVLGPSKLVAENVTGCPGVSNVPSPSKSHV